MLSLFRDQKLSKPIRRLYVDVSIIARHDAGTGIQRVVRSLWAELQSLDGDAFEVVPVAGSVRGRYRRIRSNFLDKQVRRLPWVFWRPCIKPRHGDIFLGLDLASRILPRNCRQLEAWKAAGGRIVVVVYDLLPVLHPAWFSERAQGHFANWLGVVTHLADDLVCISRTVCEDVSRWIAQIRPSSQSRPAISQLRMGGVIGREGPERLLSDQSQAIIDWAKASHTVLMVGTIEPRKGHDQALAAMSELWKNDDAEQWQLLVVGRPGWKTESLQQQLSSHPENGRRLRWLSDVSDALLDALYKASAGLLVASRGEGYGLPLAEAAAHGKPILARDLPIFREVAPPWTMFFCSEDARGLAHALEGWRTTVGRTTFPHYSPSWRTTLDDLLAVIGR